MGGRIGNANVPHNAKHQLILPKDHPVTKLLIVQEHCSNAHAGREHVLAGLCKQYWVVNARSAVKGVLRKCFLSRARNLANIPNILVQELWRGVYSWDEIVNDEPVYF